MFGFFKSVYVSKNDGFGFLQQNLGIWFTLSDVVRVTVDSLSLATEVAVDRHYTCCARPGEVLLADDDALYLWGIEHCDVLMRMILTWHYNCALRAWRGMIHAHWHLRYCIRVYLYVMWIGSLYTIRCENSEKVLSLRWQKSWACAPVRCIVKKPKCRKNDLSWMLVMTWVIFHAHLQLHTCVSLRYMKLEFAHNTGVRIQKKCGVSIDRSVSGNRPAHPRCVP